MDKLTMAHDWAMRNMWKKQYNHLTAAEMVKLSYEYADAMQAEADKREVSIAELMKDHVHDYIYGRICACGAIKE